VLERTPTDVRVWFFARNDGSAPAAVANGAQTIDPSTFAKPGAVFSSQTCDFNTHLGNHNIIINLTLCESRLFWCAYAVLMHNDAGGAWAGALFNQNGCAGSCVGEMPCCMVIGQRTDREMQTWSTPSRVRSRTRFGTSRVSASMNERSVYM
jgi:hypothetical protein